MPINQAVVAPAEPWPLQRLREIVSHRYLLLLLVQKELKVKYKGTMIGLFWSLLNPLLMMVVYTLVFAVGFRVSTPRYPIFILAGLLPWSSFAASLSSATTSVVVNAHLVRRVNFPRELLPLTSVGANLFNLLPGLLVLFLFCLGYRQALGPSLVVLPLLLVLQGVFMTGLALLVSAANVYFRDLEHLVPVALTMWFFATPVLYSLSQFRGHRAQIVLLINPMTWLIDSYQRIWHDGSWPDWTFVLGFGALALVLVPIGQAVFHRASLRFAEEI